MRRGFAATRAGVGVRVFVEVEGRRWAWNFLNQWESSTERGPPAVTTAFDVDCLLLDYLIHYLIVNTGIVSWLHGTSRCQVATCSTQNLAQGSTASIHPFPYRSEFGFVLVS